jgi:hypothetical protein
MNTSPALTALFRPPIRRVIGGGVAQQNEEQQIKHRTPLRADTHTRARARTHTHTHTHRHCTHSPLTLITRSRRLVLDAGSHTSDSLPHAFNNRIMTPSVPVTHSHPEIIDPPGLGGESYFVHLHTCSICPQRPSSHKTPVDWRWRMRSPSQRSSNTFHKAMQENLGDPQLKGRVIVCCVVRRPLDW